MFSSDIRRFFSGEVSLDVDKSGSPTKQDLRIAVVVLMVALAREDNDFAPEEAVVIAQEVSKLFRLGKEESFNLVDLVTPLSKDFEKIDEFITAINENFDDDQKQLVLAMIWRVTEADGVADKMETRFAAELRTRLNLSMEQAVRARRISEEEDERFEKTSERLSGSKSEE